MTKIVVVVVKALMMSRSMGQWESLSGGGLIMHHLTINTEYKRMAIVGYFPQHRWIHTMKVLNDIIAVNTFGDDVYR